ncbi:hypothetical protein MKZ38_001322 [Zalerion maritima]|uniref:Uncharacterized protein n=1 Tax=Zalerion maritima TaxID=339359 RepID=A0AAD5RR06_9PEZI|nr:hypothetical protein MKZ38_001322 [Zalerion maritima]
MAIYDPAALAIPQQPAYHLQSQTEYEDGDGASIRSFKKAKARKDDYKPAALRWPLLVCQILLLLLCISLIASALVLMPKSDANAVILSPTSTTNLERRQELTSGTDLASSSNSGAAESEGNSGGKEKASSEGDNPDAGPTTIADEAQTTVEKTASAGDEKATESLDGSASTTSREWSGEEAQQTQVQTTTVGGGGELSSSREDIESKTEAETTASTTSSAERTEETEVDTMTKIDEITQETISVETPHVETTDVETPRSTSESRDIVVSTPTEASTTYTSRKEEGPSSTPTEKGVEEPTTSKSSELISPTASRTSWGEDPNEETPLPDTTKSITRTSSGEEEPASADNPGPSTTKTTTNVPTEKIPSAVASSTSVPTEGAPSQETLSTTDLPSSTTKQTDPTTEATQNKTEGNDTTQPINSPNQPPSSTISTTRESKSPTPAFTSLLSTSRETSTTYEGGDATQSPTSTEEVSPSTTPTSTKSATSHENTATENLTSSKDSPTTEAPTQHSSTTTNEDGVQAPTGGSVTPNTDSPTSEQTFIIQNPGHTPSTTSKGSTSKNNGATTSTTTVLRGGSGGGEAGGPNTTTTTPTASEASASSSSEAHSRTVALTVGTGQFTTDKPHTKPTGSAVDGESTRKDWGESSRRKTTGKGIDIEPVTYTISGTTKETTMTGPTDEESSGTDSATIVPTPGIVNTETTLAYSAVRTTILTQPPAYAVVTQKNGNLITMITTPDPVTYEVTYTTQVEDSTETGTNGDNSDPKPDDGDNEDEDGEWILVSTVIVAQVGGTVTRATETHAPYSILTAINGALAEVATTPPSEVYDLTVGGTPYTYTTFYKSYRALATGGGGDFDPIGVDAYNFTPSDAFLGNFLPLVFAGVLSLTFRIIDLNVKMYQPFAAMAKEGGASARNTVTLSFFEGFKSYLTPLNLAFEGYAAPFLTTMLVGTSWLLVPLASEAISVKVHGECEEGSDDGCVCDLGVSPGFTYALLAMMTVMLLIMVLVVVLVQRWTTGLAQSPWSIAETSILAVSPQFRAPLIAIPRKAETGAVLPDRLDKIYGERKYKLGIYRMVNGDAHYGIVPSDDSTAGLATDMTPDLANNGLAGLNDPIGARTHIPFAPLKLWSRVAALVVHGAVLGLVAYYHTVSMPYTNKFEVFMDSPSAGKRLLFSAIGVSMAFWWFYFFASVAVIMPYHLMFGFPQAPERSILVDRPSNPFTGLAAAIRSRHAFLTIVSVTSILSEIMPILLANVPFGHVGLIGEDPVCGSIALAILSVMVLTLFTSLFIRWPHMPADPRTVAGATYYVAESGMISLFEGYGDLSPKVRERRIKELGQRFGYGDCMSMSGRRRYGVDADGGSLGELADDKVVESAFSSVRTRITRTVSSLSRSDGVRDLDRDRNMSGALSPGPLPRVDEDDGGNMENDNDTVRSRSPTGYLGGAVSGYGRYGPGWESEQPEEGDLSQQQPRGLREARLSDMSGYVGPIEERPPRSVDEEEYRDYFGQDTGYTGFRLDSTDDGLLHPSHSMRPARLSANFASSSPNSPGL